MYGNQWYPPQHAQHADGPPMWYFQDDRRVKAWPQGPPVDTLYRLETSGRVPSKEKYRRMICNTLLSTGLCPYNDRCVFLHDPRLRIENLKVRPGKHARSSVAPRDTFYWPDMEKMDISQKLDVRGLPDANQSYCIPTSFANDYNASRHDRAIYSLWAHLIDACLRENQPHLLPADDSHRCDPYAKYRNHHVRGCWRLPVFVILSEKEDADRKNGVNRTPPFPSQVPSALKLQSQRPSSQRSLEPSASTSGAPAVAAATAYIIPQQASYVLPPNLASWTPEVAKRSLPDTAIFDVDAPGLESDSTETFGSSFTCETQVNNEETGDGDEDGDSTAGIALGLLSIEEVDLDLESSYATAAKLRLVEQQQASYSPNSVADFIASSPINGYSMMASPAADTAIKSNKGSGVSAFTPVKPTTTFDESAMLSFLDEGPLPLPLSATETEIQSEKDAGGAGCAGCACDCRTMHLGTYTDTRAPTSTCCSGSTSKMQESHVTADHNNSLLHRHATPRTQEPPFPDTLLRGSNSPLHPLPRPATLSVDCSSPPFGFSPLTCNSNSNSSSASSCSTTGSAPRVMNAWSQPMTIPHGPVSEHGPSPVPPRRVYAGSFSPAMPPASQTQTKTQMLAARAVPERRSPVAVAAAQNHYLFGTASSPGEGLASQVQDVMYSMKRHGLSGAVTPSLSHQPPNHQQQAWGRTSPSVPTLQKAHHPAYMHQGMGQCLGQGKSDSNSLFSSSSGY